MCSAVTDDLQESRLAALRLANEVRRGRADVRRQIAHGEVTALHVLLDPPAVVGTWRVAEVLISQRGWGRVKSRKFLAANGINERKLVAELTFRQRQQLANALA